MKKLDQSVICEAHNEKGFSLIELMFVLAIMATLIHLALPSFQNQIQKSRLTDLVTQIDQLRNEYEIATQANGYPVLNRYAYSMSSMPDDIKRLGVSDTISYPGLRFAVSARRITTGQSVIEQIYLLVIDQEEQSIPVLESMLPPQAVESRTKLILQVKLLEHYL